MRPGWLVWLAWGAGCGGGDDTGAPPPTGPSCEGGGSPSLEVGSGGRDAFTAFEAGDEVPLTEQGGVWGLRLELATSGIDTRASTTLFADLGFAEGTETYGATLQLVCDPDVGIGWFALFAALPEPYDETPGPLQGTAMTFQATLTGADGTSVTDTGELVIAP